MDGESALLTAVTEALITTLSYTETQCNIEFDEIPPASVGDFYVAVMPGGSRPGPRNNTSGGILDEYIDIDIAVIQRAPKLPRDRSRQLLITALSGINARHRQILAAFGQFNYTVMNAATALLDNAEGFVEPLYWAGNESKARIVSGEYFKGQSEEEFAGLVRVAHYRGARRIQHIGISGGLT